MTDFSTLAWVWCFGFWIGFMYRDWGHGRTARIKSPREKLGDMIAEAMDEVEKHHGFVTPDISITNNLKLTRQNGKSYHVTIARWSESVDA